MDAQTLAAIVIRADASADCQAKADVQALVAEIRLFRGAMDAQDERERQASERCGVPYEQYGCDWPDAVADEVCRQADLLLHANSFRWEVVGGRWVGVMNMWDGWRVVGYRGRVCIEPEAGLTREAAIARARELVEG